MERFGGEPFRRDARGLFRMILDEAGPGFCHFAITDACNARCSFCSFWRNRSGRSTYVSADAASDAIGILYRHGIRYLIISGGEPFLHPELDRIIRCASEKGVRVIIVTNGSLLSSGRIESVAGAGLSSFEISVDATDATTHEANRGLPGLCDRIRTANRMIQSLGLRSTASVAISRLVDYDALPAFLRYLGFDSVTFSYPLRSVGSNFLGYSDSLLVSFTDDELIAAFDSVKRLKRHIRVVNPKASLDEMKRFVKKEEQRFPCLGGYRYFYLDWNLDLWRCHFWHSPLCSIFEFDGSQRVRDGCTHCMVDCFRDASVMHHLGVSLHDSYRLLRLFRFSQALKTLLRKSNILSFRATLEELSWILRI